MKKAKKKAAAKPSTAIAVRKPVAKVVIEDPKGLMLQQTPVGQLGELATVGALGLAEVKLTAEEEAVLSEAVNPQDILVRDGGIAYLPHIVYTRWFNRAFGRTGWAIVPTSAPKKVDNVVLVPYLLYIHGVPVAAATGEHEYRENNARQTYGDVIESTVACALRRCAKRLGVGLEMWDKAWLTRTMGGNRSAKHANRDEGFVDAEPVRQSTRSTQSVDDRVAQASPTITTEQRARLEAIRKKVGRDVAEVSLWLKKRYGVKSSAEIKRSDYTEICQAMEARGDLVMPGDGQ